MATAQIDISSALETAEQETDSRSIVRVFAFLIAALCFTPTCALITCATHPELAGDTLIRSE